MRKRKDEHAATSQIFRPHRIYWQDGSWWVATREGDRGPFPSKSFAEIVVEQHVRCHRQDLN